MIYLKNPDQIKKMQLAGRITGEALLLAGEAVREGVSTQALDKIIRNHIEKCGAKPSFLGYGGFPASACISVNDEVIHGIPSAKKILKEGDIISVDVGATYRGLVGDSAWTYPVGNISDECKMLLETTEKSLFAGIAKMKDGLLLEEVSGAIEDVANEKQLGIVRQYGGHGVGRQMHEDPFVFNYRVGNKFVLKKGMTIAIEPMLNLGVDDVYTLEDGWTVVTKDGKPSAHFEHTIHVTDGEPEILTKLL